MTDTLYDTDFYRWTQAQAEAVRGKLWAALDLEHLAEEIEDLGKSDRRALENHLKNLLLHNLKWAYQPQERARRGRGWQTSMDNARDAMDQVLRDSPSLRGKLDAALAWAYPRARRSAQKQTGLPLATFPERCPWNLGQLLDEDFLPEEGQP
jgi:hypothetical protein